jgi:hypothetical protein
MPGTQDQSEKLTQKPRQFLWLLLGSAGIVRIFLATHELPNGLFDDAYVTLRYAANLVRGLGLVFNSGERVMGTTSPLFTFLLAVSGGILGPRHLEALAVSFGILASLGTLYFCESSLSAVGLPPAIKWTFLAVLAFVPSFISNSVSGMETPLVLFLMSLSLYLYIKNRLLWLSIVGFLLFLARIDTGFWLLALGIDLFISRWPKRLAELVRPLLIFCGALAVWLSFLKLYFGTIVPQSVVGKGVSHGSFVIPDWNYVLTFLSAFVPAQRFGIWGLATIALVFLILIPSALDLWRNYQKLRPILYFFMLYVTTFLAVRAPLFSWYSIPSKWAFYLVVAYAIWQFLASETVRSFSPLKPNHVMALLGIILLGMGVRSTINRGDVSSADNPLAVSNFIEGNLPQTGTVFLEHIGLIGYRSGCYIYDSMGLVTPETIRLKRKYGSKWLPKAAREYHADIVIFYDSDFPAMQSQIDDDAIWFQKNYNHIVDYQLGNILASIYFNRDSTLIRKQYVK